MGLINVDNIPWQTTETVGDNPVEVKFVLKQNIDIMSTIEIVCCKECIHLQKNGQCDKTHLWIGTKEDGGCDDFFCGYGDRRE